MKATISIKAKGAVSLDRAHQEALSELIDNGPVTVKQLLEALPTLKLYAHEVIADRGGFNPGDAPSPSCDFHYSTFVNLAHDVEVSARAALEGEEDQINQIAREIAKGHVEITDEHPPLWIDSIHVSPFFICDDPRRVRELVRLQQKSPTNTQKEPTLASKDDLRRPSPISTTSTSRPTSRR